MALHLDPTKRHDAVLMVDITDGNPNGDPDSGNQPRIDPETRQGLMTDACIKRKLRNYVQFLKENANGFSILIEDGAVLRDRFQPAFEALNIPIQKGKGKASSPEQQEQLSSWLQERYWDLRMFGGVLESDLRAGQLWGPVQVGFARSIDAVLPMSITITRCASSNLQEGKDQKTMGKRELVPYGLYRAHITYSPHRAASSVTENDLQLLWDGFAKCWDFDRSSVRGFMNCQELSIFTHENKYGNASAQKLFKLISAKLKNEDVPPRKFEDYEVTVNEADLPAGVTLTKLVHG
jgi:CRISPR-associated protein Csd2